MTLCSVCLHDWPCDCESAISVDLFGACLWCRREQQTDDELQAIRDEYRTRKNRIDHVRTLQR